jgi:hypothetical protein
MVDPLRTKLSVETLNQPTYEKATKWLLSVVDPASILSAFPLIGPIAALPLKAAQEHTKHLIDQRDRERTNEHLAASVSIVSAIQAVNRKTYEYVVNSLDLTAIRALLVLNDHQDKKEFWEIAVTKIGGNENKIIEAVKTLERLGLVTTRLLFEHVDGSFQEFQDLNWAIKYTESHYDKLRDQISELRGCAVQNSKARNIDVHTSPWALISLPSLTSAGIYFLGLFEVAAEAQDQQQSA